MLGTRVVNIDRHLSRRKTIQVYARVTGAVPSMVALRLGVIAISEF